METIKIESKRTNRNLRVAAYVRGKTSSEFQFNPAMDQVEHFESFIKNHHDWEFAGVYADFNKSGITVKNRPEFLRMIENAKEGKIDVILARSVSRFSRCTHDALEYMMLLKGLGVEIWFENERLSTFDPMVGAAIDLIRQQGGETVCKSFG